MFLNLKKHHVFFFKKKLLFLSYKKLLYAKIKNTSTPYKELMIYFSIYDIKVNM